MEINLSLHGRSYHSDELERFLFQIASFWEQQDHAHNT